MTYCSNIECSRFAWGYACCQCGGYFCHQCDKRAHCCENNVDSSKQALRRFVLITGANRGIGLALVEKVLQKSSDTSVFMAARNLSQGQEARKRLIAKYPDWGTRLAVVELDVSKEDSIKAAVQQVREVLGGWPLYALVNNAGSALPDAWDTVKINTFGVLAVSSAFAPLVGSGGRIVTVSSCNGPAFLVGPGKRYSSVLTRPEVTWEDVTEVLKDCIDNQTVDLQDVPWAKGYSLSKACVNAFNVWFARQHPRLVVSACHPGFTDTDMTRPLLDIEKKSPDELGMRTPSEATVAPILCLFDTIDSGKFYNSEGKQSVLDQYCCDCCVPPLS